MDVSAWLRDLKLRLGKAGKLLRPEVFQIKQLANLLAGRFGDRQRVRRGQGAPVYGWFTEGFDTADLKEA